MTELEVGAGDDISKFHILVDPQDARRVGDLQPRGNQIVVVSVDRQTCCHFVILNS